MGNPIQEKIYTERDYENWQESERIELIDGKVYLMTPPSIQHQRILMDLSATIFNYIRSKSGSCEVFPSPFGVRLKDENGIIKRVEPDISIICDKSKLINNKFCDGSPDMIIEIVSPSSVSYDYITKANLYQKSGVKEYWIVNPMVESVSVYRLSSDGEYNNITHYTFTDEIPVGIFEELMISIRSL